MKPTLDDTARYQFWKTSVSLPPEPREISDFPHSAQRLAASKSTTHLVSAQEPDCSCQGLASQVTSWNIRKGLG